MEVRCKSCNKLFRIADEKITGSGIKFACSKCGNPVKITKDVFEQHLQSKKVAPESEPVVLAPKPLKMEVRCGSCSKLFKVSEDKISGAGIKFACSKCGSVVKITREDFEKHLLSRVTEPVRDAGISQSLKEHTPVAPDVVKPSQPPLAAPMSTEADSIFPSPAPDLPIPTKPVARQEPVPAPEQTAVDRTIPAAQALETSPVQKKTAKTASPVSPVKQPSPPVQPVAASSSPFAFLSPGNMIILGMAFMVVIAIAFGLISHKQSAKPLSVEPENAMVSNEGLEAVNLTGTVDAQGDLVLSGSITNATDKERTAWLVVADVFDARGALLRQVKVLNGRQLYTKMDLDTAAKRGEDVWALKSRMLQREGINIPPGGSVPFVVHIIEPPAGYASFYASPQPVNPAQLYGEAAASLQQP